MRLLWEENALGVVGAFCVAACALGAVWMLLEGFLGLGGAASGLLASASAVATIEAISRRRHPAPAPRAETEPRLRVIEGLAEGARGEYAPREHIPARSADRASRPRRSA